MWAPGSVQGESRSRSAQPCREGPQMTVRHALLIASIASAILHFACSQPATAAVVGVLPNDQVGFVNAADARGFILTASPGVTDPGYIITGFGEVVGFATSKLYVDPNQAQWRLNTQNHYVEVLDTHTDYPSIRVAHARIALQGFNPDDIVLSGEQVSFTGLAAASTLIREFTAASPLRYSVVAGHHRLRSLPTGTNRFGRFVHRHRLLLSLRRHTG